MSLRQAGLFRKTIAAIAGGGGTATYDAFATNDDGGDHLGVDPVSGTVVPPVQAGFQTSGGTQASPQTYTKVGVLFVPTAYAMSGTQAIVSVTHTLVNNTAATALTGLVVTITNALAGAGNTVAGFLYILVMPTSDAG